MACILSSTIHSEHCSPALLSREVLRPVDSRSLAPQMHGDAPSSPSGLHLDQTAGQFKALQSFTYQLGLCRYCVTLARLETMSCTPAKKTGCMESAKQLESLEK